jgi:hypothetical protein
VAGTGTEPTLWQTLPAYYEELKDHPDVYQQVESGAKKIAHARREVGAVTKKLYKKKLLSDDKGAKGFLSQVEAYAVKHIEKYEDSKVLSHHIDTKQNKVVLTLTIKL